MGRLLDTENVHVAPAAYARLDSSEAEYDDWEGKAKEVAAVLDSWEEALDVQFDFENFGSTWSAVMVLGELVWDVALMRVLESGYDVYRGLSFIEVYKVDIMQGEAQ
jgi:hypothetical protein